jgi:oligopeptide transport system permease protein
LILLIAVVALFPTLFTQVSPNLNCLLANSNGVPEAGHPFGFTRQGCDVYARTIHGTQASVTVGLLATALVTLIGIIVGSLAGYYGGWLDALVSRIGDIFFAIPTVLGAIVLMSVLPAATPTTVAFVLAIFAWPQIARIMRGAVLSATNSDYVMASTALGVSRFRILLRHVIPNAIAPVIVIATVSLGTFIVAEATLSFLGIGLPTSVMSWGNDIGQAQTSLVTNPQVLLYPAAALSLTVLAFLMLGDILRDALDPKARALR